LREPRNRTSGVIDQEMDPIGHHNIGVELILL
jgi:hypothetical protein